MVARLGNVNGYVKSQAWLGNKRFEFDGTTRGLTISALAKGAKAGDIILANYGGRLKSETRQMYLVATPKDDRAGGFWMERGLTVSN